MPVPLIVGAASIAGLSRGLSGEDIKKRLEVAKYIYNDSKERTINFRNEICKILDNRSRAEIELEKDYLKFMNLIKNMKNIPDVDSLLYDKLDLKDISEYEHKGEFNEYLWNNIDKFKLGALGIAAATNLEVDVEEDGLIYDGENLSAEFLGRELLPNDIDFDGIDIDKVLAYNKISPFVGGVIGAMTDLENSSSDKDKKTKENKVNQIYDESLAYERKNYEIRERLEELNKLVDKYMGIFNRLKEIYFESLSKMEYIVSELQVDDYNDLRNVEKNFFKTLLNSVATLDKLFNIKLLTNGEKIELDPNVNNELDEIEKLTLDLGNLFEDKKINLEEDKNTLDTNENLEEFEEFLTKSAEEFAKKIQKKLDETDGEEREIILEQISKLDEAVSVYEDNYDGIQAKLAKLDNKFKELVNEFGQNEVNEK